MKQPKPEHAHATFFLIGDRAAAHPDLVEVIKAGGHEVGNHCLHRGTALAAGASFRGRLLQAEQAIGPSPPKLHDGISDPSRSIRALPAILAEGDRRGLQFVTFGALLRSRGTT